MFGEVTPEIGQKLFYERLRASSESENMSDLLVVTKADLWDDADRSRLLQELNAQFLTPNEVEWSNSACSCATCLFGRLLLDKNAPTCPHSRSVVSICRIQRAKYTYLEKVSQIIRGAGDSIWQQGCKQQLDVT